MSVRPQSKDKPTAAGFQWDDPFLLDEQLSEDERIARSANPTSESSIADSMQRDELDATWRVTRC